MIPLLFTIVPQIFTFESTGLELFLGMEGTKRANIRPGIAVLVELTEDKRTGKLTGGRVKEILTSSPIHPHGIKVMLENGLIGRIKQII